MNPAPETFAGSASESGTQPIHRFGWPTRPLGAKALGTPQRNAGVKCSSTTLGGLRGPEWAQVASLARSGKDLGVTEALLLVDVLKDFRHEDGDALLESYRRRHPVLVSLLSEARARGVPVVYANDRGENGQPGEVVREAVEEGKAGELVAEVAPVNGEPVLLKDAYSAAMRPRAWTTRTKASRSTISSASWGSRLCAVRNSRASDRVYERPHDRPADKRL